MATTVDPAAFRAHQDEVLHGARVSPGPVPFTAGSYYTPAPVGPAPRWPKHPSFYPLEKPRRQPKAAPPSRDATKPSLRSRPPPKSASAKLPGKVARTVRRSPTSSSEELDLPSTPSPRATPANDIFSDSTSGSRDSNDTSGSSSPTPASPHPPPKPALRSTATATLTASGSSSFTSRRSSLEGRAASASNILFPHQSFSTTYSSRSHDSYLHSTASSTASTPRLPKRVSFADNLVAPPTPNPYPATTDAPAPAARPLSPRTTAKPLLHTSLRACRHPTCAACASHNQAPHATTAPGAKDTHSPSSSATSQLDSVCSTVSTSSSLTDPSLSHDAGLRGPPTPPLEEEEAAYENPTFADDSDEVFHTPRGDHAPLPPPLGSAQPRPGSPVLPLPVRSPTLSLNPLHHAAAFAPIGRPAGPMPPHHLPVASDQTVPRHPALLSGTDVIAEYPAVMGPAPRTALAGPAPTPVTAPATPAEPSTPRGAAMATPLPSPKPSPIRTLQARLAALATTSLSSPTATPATPTISPTAHSVDGAAPKPTLSLRARLQMPSTFLRTHSGLLTSPAASPSKPSALRTTSVATKVDVLKTLAENGYERQKNGWGLLMWDSSAAVTRKPSAAQNSLFGFEAAMLAEVEARKAREAEEAYKVGPGGGIIGSCGGWREGEAARVAAKGASSADNVAAVPIELPGSGFVKAGGRAQAVAPFGCFIPFMRAKKGSKARAAC